MSEKGQQHPPRIAEALLRRLLPEREKLDLLGDHEEYFGDVSRRKGRFIASFWYWTQIIILVSGSIWNSLKWGLVMIRNYLKTAFRNIKRHKGYAFINVMGLSIGMACCIVIFLYIFNESTYDRFNRNADRIHRVAEYRKVPAGEFQFGKISPMVAQVMKNDFPQVEYAGRIMPLRNGLIQYRDKGFYEDRVVYADQDIFNVLTIPFTHGDSAAALVKPRTAVITERMAEKYFGTKNPIGETIQINDPVWEYRGFYVPFPSTCDYVVTGVVKNAPSNSHFKYDFILSLKTHEGGFLLNDWHSRATYTYILLAAGVNATDFENQISGIAEKYISRQLHAWGQMRSYFLQPLLDIHYGSHLRDEMEPTGNRLTIYVYSVIGFLVLLIGCMNFINLSNARSIHRKKEVALRKMIGAGRGQLINQLLYETGLITLVALGFAFFLSALILPGFNEMAGTDLTFNTLSQPAVIVALAGLMFIVVLLAGGYPAYLLTRFKAGLIIRGKSSSEGRGSVLLRILVVGQFVITIFFIIGTLTVTRQLQFMRGGTLGFSKSQKYIIPFRMNKPVRDHYTTLKSELEQHHSIVGVTVSSSVPGSPIDEKGLKTSPDKLEKPFRMKYISMDDDFIFDYHIKMATGRPLSEEKNDKKNSILINEAAVGFLGYGTPEEAIGKRWCSGAADGVHVYREIVGVTRNFHYQGMQSRVEPLFMDLNSREFSFFTLTLTVGDLPEAMEFIQKTWRRFAPSVPFEGFILDAHFDRQYQREVQVGKLLGFIAGLGLFIACLGLFGLVAFTAERRTKEIGIRKVMGSSVIGVVVLLTKELTRWVLMANLFAWPIGYLAITKWLQHFAYRVNTAWWVFLLSGMSALMIALITVAFHTFRAASANPVDSLRYE